ncbi:hypothetical protein K443DRAFT_244394 [Laccaria amethystina LaAM-08-1]|uniref:Uncharacterized protein n=1 Tax=Laccaria amethystina LaAM-08-1 TaxID=1095629 RepID=A0A0C9WXH4_9AGAR|nr:hypothetical protein K443DRAFT_244394 [Laccaria amethystina LaAM-08-1]
MQQSALTAMGLRLLRCILMLPGLVTGFPCSSCFIEGLVTGLDDTLHEPRRYLRDVHPIFVLTLSLTFYLNLLRMLLQI